ncbi:1-acyl-sn-glycerol-3-phosphate acyltransferase [Kocuria indica]|uniref:1-acyl-sn-glycerol-3-phosphate acyltransferase n=1 Tax=Kocuria marina subsp. indica TaxID=1049583 RepID=A0A6N9QW97_9MICC|nr:MULTISPECIES: lysophospholipid acyltransferase family protein [Kocuria]MCT1616697.1 1-acyl-sn-glycerol-3-phosphate acyltransferase [Kocuria marina]NDO77502.1 1-acyl-sn-glycerol-3-phosphate acyltransferase [Kocuria indica]
MITKYDLTKASVARALRLLCRPVITGLENLPQDGPVIIASNHLSFLDSVIISAFMPRRVKFIAKAEYVNSPGIKGKLMREAFEFIDIIPVTRGQQSESVAALDPAVEHLKQGNVFGIYPEGTRSRDGYLYRGHSGVAYLAYVTGAPVVPVGLIGTQRLQPPGATMIRPAKFEMHVGEPIPTPESGGHQTGKLRKAHVEQIMTTIAGLSGQPRKDVYNVSPSAQRDAGRG